MCLSCKKLVASSLLVSIFTAHFAQADLSLSSSWEDLDPTKLSDVKAESYAWGSHTRFAAQEKIEVTKGSALSFADNKAQQFLQANMAKIAEAAGNILKDKIHKAAYATGFKDSAGGDVLDTKVRFLRNIAQTVGFNLNAVPAGLMNPLENFIFGQVEDAIKNMTSAATASMLRSLHKASGVTSPVTSAFSAADQLADYLTQEVANQTMGYEEAEALKINTHDPLLNARMELKVAITRWLHTQAEASLMDALRTVSNNATNQVYNNTTKVLAIGAAALASTVVTPATVLVVGKTAYDFMPDTGLKAYAQHTVFETLAPRLRHNLTTFFNDSFTDGAFAIGPLAFTRQERALQLLTITATDVVNDEDDFVLIGLETSPVQQIVSAVQSVTQEAYTEWKDNVQTVTTQVTDAVAQGVVNAVAGKVAPVAQKPQDLTAQLAQAYTDAPQGSQKQQDALKLMDLKHEVAGEDKYGLVKPTENTSFWGKMRYRFDNSLARFIHG